MCSMFVVAIQNTELGAVQIMYGIKKTYKTNDEVSSATEEVYGS